MVGIYLSGTGNTKNCVEKLVAGIDAGAKCIPLENEQAVEAIKQEDMIVLGYPVQFSNAPVMVREFIKEHGDIWKGKKVLCVATQALFSGDGTGCAARILKKYGAKIVGGVHFLMPDAISDNKMLKNTQEKNRSIIAKTDERIEIVIDQIKNGKYPKDGIHFYSRIVGLLGQRLWFYSKTIHYSNKLKISDACVGCGHCVEVCPMSNLKLQDGKVIANQQCTMCYRCISQCPKQAITLLGNKVVQQYRFQSNKF